jgi:hypothetical protein
MCLSSSTLICVSIRIKTEPYRDKTPYKSLFADILLLISVANGCVATSNTFVSRFIADPDWRKYGELARTIQNVLSPLGHTHRHLCQMLHSSADVEMHVENHPGRSPLTKVQLPPKDDDTLSHDSKMSPNVLLLFLESTAFPTLSVCAPPVNHRSLQISRVWSETGLASDINPGSIATLLGLGEGFANRDPHFTALCYLVFPYTVSESVMEGDLIPATGPAAPPSRLVFSHESSVATNHHCNHVTEEDLRGMLQLLSGVRTHTIIAGIGRR